MTIGENKVLKAAAYSIHTKTGMLHALFLTTILVVAYHIIAGLLLSIAPVSIIKSALLQVFGLLLPGAALYSLLFDSKRDVVEYVVISYALGYCSNILTYFLLVPFGLKAFIPYAIVLIAIISGIIIWKRHDKISMLNLGRENWPLLLIFFIYLGLSFIAYSAANAPVFLTGSAWYPTDFVFWIENAAALSIGFPAIEPRVYTDLVLYYHYFTSVHLAFSSLASGVDLFTLGTAFYTVGKCILFFGSFYLLFKSITANRTLQLLALCAVLFCDGATWLLVVTYVSHTWTNPFGFDIGYAFGALFLYCFYLQYEQKNFNWKLLVLNIAVFALCVGSKAPVAAIVMVAAGIVCFSWLLKRQYKLAFSYGISLIGVFMGIGVGCIGFFVSTVPKLGSFSTVNFINNSPILDPVYQLMGRYDLPQVLKIGSLAAISAVCVHPIIICLYALATLYLLTDRQLRNAPNVGLFIAGLTGLALGIFNVQPGTSQMYFTMAALIPCATLDIAFLDARVKKWDAVAKRSISILGIALICAQMCLALFLGYTYWGNGLTSALHHGYENLTRTQQDFRIDGIQANDLSALIWVRDNTPKNSVLLSDRSVVGNMPGYMFYGMLTERQMYIEGDVYFRELVSSEREHMRDITNQVFKNSSDALETAAQEGVDYILQTKWITPDFSPDPNLATLVYSGATINVYEVNE